MNDEQLFEKVGDRMSWFAGGYAYGLVGEANIAWLKDQSYGDVFWYGNIYRLGYAAAFDAPKIMDDTIRVKLRNFLDDTDGLEDYPIVDDSYYSDVLRNAEDKWVEDFARYHNLDSGAVMEYFRENEIYFEEEGDYVYPVIENANEELLAMDIRRTLQTWETHYMGGQYHDELLCQYCADTAEFERQKREAQNV